MTIVTIVSEFDSEYHPRNFLLVRHGATKMNNDDVSVDRIRGWKDVELSRDGMREAERLGKKLKSDPPDVIVSSDLLRARETAEIISLTTKAPLWDITQDFRPWNLGDFAGMVTEEVLPAIARFACDTPMLPVPNGESFDSFKCRFFNGLAATLQRHEGIIAIVTHHRCERLLKAWMKAGLQTDGTIDLGEFTKRGEATGNVDFISLDPDNVLYAADWLREELERQGA